MLHVSHILGTIVSQLFPANNSVWLQSTTLAANSSTQVFKLHKRFRFFTIPQICMDKI